MVTSFSVIKIDFADGYKFTQCDGVRYFVLFKFTELEILKLLNWSLEPEFNYMCSFEIIQNIKKYDPEAEKFFISDPILLNTFSSARLLHGFIINNKDLIAAKTQYPETVIVIHLKKVKNIYK